MELVGFFAGSSGSISAGLGTCQSTKSKRVDTVYSRGVSYKKPKKPVIGVVIDLSAGPLDLENLGGAGVKPGISWGSKVNSVTSSISDLSNIENMANTIAEETSYAESGRDDNMDKTMPRKTRTQTFVLGNPLNDNDVVLDLPSCVDIGSNQLPLLRSHALEMRNFNTTKSLMLNIELFAVPGKLVSDKLISLKKIFYHVDGFGGASTPSKFSGIIRLSFTSEFSLNKTRKMAICKKILVNDDVRKANNCSDQEVIIKEISVDLPRLAVESVFSKFDKIALVEFELSKVANQVVSMWSIFMGKNSVHISRDQHRALLYTFLVDTTAHDLSNLLVSYGGKSCFISHNLSLYVCDRCAVICFGNEVSKLAAIGTIPIFKGVSLHWAGLSLACCSQCKQFGHISVNCLMSENSGGYGRMAFIVRPVSFGDKTWAQVAGDSSSCMVLLDTSGVGSTSGINSLSMSFGSLDVSDLGGCLVFLECFLELLTDQVSGIMKKLSFVELVLLVPSSRVSPLNVSVSVVSVVETDMALDSGLTLSIPSVFGANVSDAVLSSSGLKVLTSKVGGLKSKMSALEALIGSVLDKFDEVRIFTFGLDVSYLGAGVAVIMNNSLAHHISKVEEIPGWVVSVRLLFKGKLSVIVLGLYAGASSGTCFSQASEVNSFIAKAVNISIFIMLSGDFNESKSGRSVSFKGVEKTIDYIFVSKNLSSAVAKYWIGPVSEFFDTDYSAVMVSIDLGEFLNVQLNSLHKQANKDCWKFRIRNADVAKWSKFKNCVSDKLLLVKDFFSEAKAGGNLNTMWAILEEGMVESADEVFIRHWFSEFQCPRNKHSLKFFGLELFVAKIVSKIGSGDMLGVDCLVRKWFILDETKASTFFDLVILGRDSVVLLRHLLSVRKKYRRSKMFKSKLAEETSIRKAIEKHMESFASNKGGMN
ncbi:hypothetical protein G9A89_019826 [Geosiphon pyriformis]|nr:hypothetical protein G9A89_019826 [Geosiphon pyriformis]